MEAASGHVLHDEVDVGVGLECLDELDDVGMVHLLQEDDLSPHAPLPVDVRQLRLVINLDGILLIVFSRGSSPYNCVRSLANLSTELVVVHSILLLCNSILSVTDLRRIVGRVVVDQNLVVAVLFAHLAATILGLLSSLV